MITNDEKYLKSVETFANGHTDFNFRGLSPEHAAIVLANILNNSKDEAKIYDYSINGDVADKDDIFTKSLYRFLSQGKKIKIVVRDKSESDAAIYEELAHYSEQFPNKIDIRLASEIFKENVKSLLGKDVNFSVNDSNGYRLELTEFSPGNEDRVSISNFNDLKRSQQLSKLFDSQFNSCQKITLPLLA